MKILFLGSENSHLLGWLYRDNSLIQTSQEINPEFVDQHNVDFIISYNYRHILRKDVLDKVKAINLHISYLPWNRGADPNFWSFLDNTPKGVTIHYIDEGIDTGNIISQKQVHFDESKETLSSTYYQLQYEIQELFKNQWNNILKGEEGIKPLGKGSYHKLRDKTAYMHLLTEGWDTKVCQLKR